MNSPPFDLLIRGGMILPLDDAAHEGLIPCGYVGVRDGCIAACGHMAELPAGAHARETLDATGLLVMPGLVNAHTHAAMTLFRGLADDLPLMEWLTRHIFPAEARFVTPEMVYWCTKLAAAEMLLSGTTTVADGYFHEGEAARAFQESGLRAVVAQGVIDFPAPGAPDPSANVAVAGRFLQAWQGADPRVSPAVFCHSPYTCSPETLVAAKRLAAARGALLFLHLAETEDEGREIAKRHGKSPARLLRDLDLLDPRTVCVHGVWLSSEDRELLAAAGAGVVTCPESNMKLASGIAPVPELLAAGVPVALGTDGAASNNDLDLFGELGTLARLHKVHRHDPTVLPARQALRLATAGGAQVLGLGASVGALTPGKRADLILLDRDTPHLTPFHNPDLLVYAAKGTDVRHVIVDGRVLVRDRQILTMDLAETMARVRELAQSVQETAREGAASS